MAGRVRVGIGGWDYDPWRETFYPPGLPKTKQLEHAAARLGAIEINATFYRLQRPETFEKWAGAVPDGFKFAVKGSRFCSNRKVLAEAGEAVARFCAQGLTALGDRLGPILWQFAATKRFDADDFGAFLDLLPRRQDGVALTHVVEPRHESFRDPAFFDLARAAHVGVVYAEADHYPTFEPLAGIGPVYARLQQSRADEPCGYPVAELDRIADMAHRWSEGGDAYVFFISGAKERNPAAAMALIDRLNAA